MGQEGGEGDWRISIAGVEWSGAGGDLEGGGMNKQCTGMGRL